VSNSNVLSVLMMMLTYLHRFSRCCAWKSNSICGGGICGKSEMHTIFAMHTNSVLLPVSRVPFVLFSLLNSEPFPLCALHGFPQLCD